MTASLADAERWPELAAPSSPPLSDDEGDELRPRNVTGFPGATGLKYTQTILGPSRTGLMGMRVGDRRSTAGPRRSARFSARIRKDHAPVEETATATSAPLPSQEETARESSPPLSSSARPAAVSVTESQLLPEDEEEDGTFSSGDESSVADDEEFDDGLDLDEDDFGSLVNHRVSDVCCYYLHYILFCLVLFTKIRLQRKTHPSTNPPVAISRWLLHLHQRLTTARPPRLIRRLVTVLTLPRVLQALFPPRTSSLVKIYLLGSP